MEVPLYVKDLKNHLKRNQISPERLAESSTLSHMTIRRWLRKKDHEPLPEKYYPLLKPIFTPPQASPDLNQAALLLTESTGKDFEGLIDELEKSGKDYDNLPKLNVDIREKLKDPGIGASLKKLVTTVVGGVTAKGIPLRSRAICVGALLYLINPFDLIPDATPLIGYLDDFAVLSLAAAMIAKDMKGTKSS